MCLEFSITFFSFCSVMFFCCCWYVWFEVIVMHLPYFYLVELLLTRTNTDGWFFSFTRVACCSFGQPENISHHNMGRLQEKTKGNAFHGATMQVKACFYFHHSSFPLRNFSKTFIVLKWWYLRHALSLLTIQAWSLTVNFHFPLNVMANIIRFTGRYHSVSGIQF